MIHYLNISSNKYIIVTDEIENILGKHWKNSAGALHFECSNNFVKNWLIYFPGITIKKRLSNKVLKNSVRLGRFLYSSRHFLKKGNTTVGIGISVFPLSYALSRGVLFSGDTKEIKTKLIRLGVSEKVL